MYIYIIYIRIPISYLIYYCQVSFFRNISFGSEQKKKKCFYLLHEKRFTDIRKVKQKKKKNELLAIQYNSLNLSTTRAKSSDSKCVCVRRISVFGSKTSTVETTTYKSSELIKSHSIPRTGKVCELYYFWFRGRISYLTNFSSELCHAFLNYLYYKVLNPEKKYNSTLLKLLNKFVRDRFILWYCTYLLKTRTGHEMCEYNITLVQ